MHFYKTNTDQMNQIIISSLDLNISFFHGLQFLDDRAHFVTGKIHVIEVVRQFLPRIVSVINLNFLGTGSLFQSSSRLTSKTLPMRSSDEISVWVLETTVFPTLLTLYIVN